MDRFKWIQRSLLGDDREQEDDLLGEFGDGSCSLSPLQRLYGFAASIVIGFAFMLLSLVVFYKPIKFALLFTFGNLFAVGREEMITTYTRTSNMQTRLYLSSVTRTFLSFILKLMPNTIIGQHSLPYRATTAGKNDA